MAGGQETDVRQMEDRQAGRQAGKNMAGTVVRTQTDKQKNDRQT